MRVTRSRNPQPLPTTPRLPASFLRPHLEAVGFVGWHSWNELRAAGFELVPRTAGAYLVYRPSPTPPRFAPVGTGAYFKGRDPNVAIPVLKGKWVPGTHTVYLGKGHKLRPRLKSYARFGTGERVAHWGGRYIWQLADAAELLVAWRELDDDVATARDDEVGLLGQFMALHGGQRPFANLIG